MPLVELMYHPQDKEGNNVLYVFCLYHHCQYCDKRVWNSNLISIFDTQKKLI